MKHPATAVPQHCLAPQRQHPEHSPGAVVKKATYITTSWDDGHPLDLHLADLLVKYALRGTFYVPKTAEHGTLTPAQVAELGRTFEVGAHTLQHVDLSEATESQARQEIVQSKSWLEDITGAHCSIFCPPKGKYTYRHLELIRQAGFDAVRSVELLSLDFPRRQAGVQVMPTTVQAHPHGPMVYARNALKRAVFKNLWRYFAHVRSRDWSKLVLPLLSRALEHGGVFHLWGHSWEIEQTGQWRRLEEMLRLLSGFASEATALTNFEVCQACCNRDMVEPAPMAASPVRGS